MGGKNVALAVLLSFGILLGWEMLIMRPRRQGMPPPPSTAAPVMRSADEPVAETQAPERKRVVDFEIGKHKISFNVFGAGVEQWLIQEASGHWTPLVMEGPFEARPLTTFAEREFR